MKLELCVKNKKGKAFQTGILNCGVVWQPGAAADQFNCHAWNPSKKIKNVKHKRDFEKRAGEFVHLNDFLKRMEIRINYYHMGKLKRMTKARDVWVNWKEYSNTLRQS